MQHSSLTENYRDRFQCFAAGKLTNGYALYGFLYSILQIEDYALTMGSGLLLFVLLVVMYQTRNQNRVSEKERDIISSDKEILET